MNTTFLLLNKLRSVEAEVKWLKTGPTLHPF